MASSPNTVSKPEIACVALFLLEGHERYIHTEDIAILCNKLAPGRFQWQRHPEQISLDKVRHALNDGKKPAHGRLVMGSNATGWMLTEAGLRHASDRADEVLASDQSGSPLPPKEAGRLRRERERLVASTAFQKAKGGDYDQLTLQDAESFFRVDDYVLGAARERRIVRLLNTFAQDPDISPIATRLADILRQGKRCPHDHRASSGNDARRS